MTLVAAGRDLALLTTSGLRMAREDPAWLAVQAARRLVPRWRSRLQPNPDADGLSAIVGAFVADQPQRAAELLRRRGVTGRRLGDALAARIAVQVGAPDALAPEMASRPEVAAALAQQRGDLSGALAALRGTRGAAATKLLSEWRMLQPGFRLPVPEVRAERASKESPRVLHILTNSLPHTRSGYTMRTQRLLKASQDAGIIVEAVTRIGYPTTIGLPGRPDVDVIDGVLYQRLHASALAAEPHRRLEQQVAALLPLTQRFRPTVLHTTTDFTNALVAQALSAAIGVPWVYEMRGQLELSWIAARPEPYREAAALSERVRLLRAKEAELAAAADAVVVLSEVQRDDIIARGVPRDRILVVPNAIDESWLARDTEPADAREKLGLPREGLWVGTVTSMVEYEGLDVLLKAVALIRSDGIDVRVALVGDGVSRPGLQDLVRDLGLGGVAVLPGRVPSQDAVGWYEALDMFVVPRRDTPVCRVVTPLKPVEAMALGRPVVVSDLPALREIVDGGKAGVLSPAGNVEGLRRALELLAADGSLRLRFAYEGRESVAERTWARGAEGLIGLYRRGGRPA